MFNFINLDETTRSFMVKEIAEAASTGNIYFSKRFNEAGAQHWVSLLSEAAELHAEHWLAFQIESQGLMKEFEGSKTPSGGYTTKHVPHNASETLAEGQFNRFYILALCAQSKSEGKAHVTVYRAKERSEHRAESDELIGSSIDVDQLYEELKNVKSSLRHTLVKPNSGLSVKLE